MSIWGPGAFENDDGADWFADLREKPALQTVKDVLEEISNPEHIGYIEVTDGAEAVAAAEVLAELLAPASGRQVGEGMEEVSESLRDELERESHAEVDRLVNHAIDAIEIILNDAENSELRQLWEEHPEEMAVWIQYMIGLQQRLRSSITL